MQRFISKRTTKLLAGAAMLGLASAANAALMIDVRTATNGKSAVIPVGGTVTLNVYLTGGDTDLPNGLGGYALAVRSSGESSTAGGPTVAWTANPSPTNTVVNATGGTNETPTSVFDLGYSAGTNTDVTALSNNPDPSDTDLDRSGLAGTQSSSGGWFPTYGQVNELLLGTMTFTAQGAGQAGAVGGASEYLVDLNAYYANTTGAAGSSIIRGLTSSDTTTNGTTTNLLTGVGNIGTPVQVTVQVPEPASLGLLSIASFGLLGRRRRA